MKEFLLTSECIKKSSVFMYKQCSCISWDDVPAGINQLYKSEMDGPMENSCRTGRETEAHGAKGLARQPITDTCQCQETGVTVLFGFLSVPHPLL